MRGHTLAALTTAALVAAGAGVGAAQEAPTVEGTYSVSSGRDGQRTAGVRHAFGAVWVNVGNSSLVRLNPKTGATRRVPRVKGGITDYVEGFGRMWILSSAGRRSYVTEVNGRTGKRMRVRALRGQATSLTAGPGAVWVALSNPRNTIARVPLSTGKVTMRPLQGTPVSDVVWLFAQGGSLWTYAQGSTIDRWRTPRLTRTAQIDGVPEYGTGAAQANGAFYVWPASDNGGVAAFSRTGALGTLQFTTSTDGGYAESVALGAGSVWMLWSNSQGTSLTKATPSLQDPATVDVSSLVEDDDGPGPAVAYGGGSLWMTDGDRSVIRIAPSSVG